VLLEAEEEIASTADDSNKSDTPNATGGKSIQSSQLEQIIQRLPTCVNRVFIDDVSNECIRLPFLCVRKTGFSVTLLR
jgi:hypothetical protein